MAIALSANGQFVAIDTAASVRLTIVRLMNFDASVFLERTRRSFNVAGPMRFIINGKDTLYFPTPKGANTEGWRRPTAMRVEISAPPNTSICVQYTTTVTFKSVVNSKHVLDTTVCFGTETVVPSLIIFGFELTRGSPNQPRKANTLLITDAQINASQRRRLRQRWKDMAVEKVELR